MGLAMACGNGFVSLYGGDDFRSIRVVLQRGGAACARPLKGGVWPSLPANASGRKDSFSTATGACIDRAHQPTRGWLTATFWVPFRRCLGRERASPTHSEHFRAMKMFY